MGDTNWILMYTRIYKCVRFNGSKYLTHTINNPTLARVRPSTGRTDRIGREPQQGLDGQPFRRLVGEQ
jgi:hypothetical protein